MAKETTVESAAGEMARPRKSTDEFEAPSKRHEMFGVCTALMALFLLLGLVSYEGTAAEGAAFGESNWMGMAGQWTSYFLFTLLGVTAYLLDAFLWVFSVSLFIPRPKHAFVVAMTASYSAICVNRYGGTTSPHA